MSFEVFANLPSEFGNFKLSVFSKEFDGKEHVAIIKGDVQGKDDVAVRMHSECLTGDVLGSLRCDCRSQLIASLQLIESLPCGVVLYLRQEGRGIGLTNKIKAYALQEKGMDTVQANVHLGFEDDQRTYDVAAKMLKELGIQSVKLITNNPKKIAGLKSENVTVTERIPLEIDPNKHNLSYLQTKKEKSGHMLSHIE